MKTKEKKNWYATAKGTRRVPGTEVAIPAKWKQKCGGGCGIWLKKGRLIYLKNEAWVCEGCVVDNDTGRIAELKRMAYKQYLQTPEWRTKRNAALKRARFKCELCYRDERLNVHHKTYAHRGHERLSDLTVLCRECHAKFHDKLELKED